MYPSVGKVETHYATDRTPPAAPPSRGFIGDIADNNDNILIRLNALNERAAAISDRLFGSPAPAKDANASQPMSTGLSWLSQQQTYMHMQLQLLGETLDRLDRL